MKTDNSDETDAALRALLKEWKAEPPLPTRFQEQVWRRIERVEAAPGQSGSFARVFADWIAQGLTKPVPAMACAAALLVLGASAGLSQARQEAARVAVELGARYAQAVDPYVTAAQP